MTFSKLLRWLPFIVFASLALFLWRGLSGNPHELPSMRLGKPVPSFLLPTLDASGTGQFSSQILLGQYALLNVFASWCAACTEEQAFLTRLSKQGVPIYGLNYQDEPDAAKKWLEIWGNPYQSIGQDSQGRVAMDLGVYGTPETFLIDPNGIIQYRYAGVLTESVWQREFLPKMR